TPRSSCWARTRSWFWWKVRTIGSSTTASGSNGTIPSCPGSIRCSRTSRSSGTISIRKRTTERSAAGCQLQDASIGFVDAFGADSPALHQVDNDVHNPFGDIGGVSEVVAEHQQIDTGVDGQFHGPLEAEMSGDGLHV